MILVDRVKHHVGRGVHRETLTNLLLADGYNVALATNTVQRMVDAGTLTEGSPGTPDAGWVQVYRAPEPPKRVVAPEAQAQEV